MFGALRLGPVEDTADIPKEREWLDTRRLGAAHMYSR